MNNMKRNIEIIKLSTKDLFNFMPKIIVTKVLLVIIYSIFSIVNISLLANLIDLVGILLNNSTVKKELIIITAEYICSYVILQGISIFLYYIDNILILPKTELFHHKLSNHLTKISLEATHNPEIQNLFWRAKDAVYQDRMISVFMTVFNIIPIIIQLVGTIIILCKYSIVLVLIAIISIIPSTFISFLIGKKEYKHSVEHTKENRFFLYLWEIMTKKESIRENQIFNFMDYIKEIFKKTHKKIQKDNKKLLIKKDIANIVSEGIKILCHIGALFFIISLVHKKEISIGMFAACIGLFTNMQGVATQLFSYFSQVDNVCKYSNDYYSFFDLPIDENKIEHNIEKNKLIELKNVYYTYNGTNSFALNDISMEIKKGEFIVIVGENGSGKTTLSKVIMGLYNPSHGTINVNENDTSNFSKDNYYKNISVSLQNFEKYAISLIDNVRVSDIMKPVDNIEQVFEKYDIINIKNRLGSFDAMLGIEFGDADLSGGEWQKVALARTMYKTSEIIILDEPTSAIDPLLEYDLLNQYINAKDNHTCIIISHRVGICKKADKIFVMDKGKIVEQGTHTELIEKKGKYFNLWDAQAKWYN